jgi:hypothetical protein
MEAELKRISTLFCEGKILRAYDAFEKLSAEAEQLHSETLDRNSEWIQLLAERYLTVRKCLSSKEGLGWTLGSEIGGLKAYYEIQSDGSLSACVAGTPSDHLTAFHCHPLS